MTEKYGTLLLTRDGQTIRVAGVPEVAARGQGGLLDVTLPVEAGHGAAGALLASVDLAIEVNSLVRQALAGLDIRPRVPDHSDRRSAIVVERGRVEMKDSRSSGILEHRAGGGLVRPTAELHHAESGRV